METQEQIESARQKCAQMKTEQFRRRLAAISDERLALLRIGEQSDAADRRLVMLESAESIVSAELRSRREKEAV